MKAESIVIGVAGSVFGLIVGWIIGTQQAPARSFAPGQAPAQAAAQAPAGAPPASAPAPALDEAQVTALRNIADKDPANVQSRVQLGNMYFDAERYQDAIQWYEAALKLNPNDAIVSTDLGVCFYYTNQADRAPPPGRSTSAGVASRAGCTRSTRRRRSTSSCASSTRRAAGRCGWSPAGSSATAPATSTPRWDCSWN